MRRCRDLKVSEKRSDAADYKELVLFNRDLARWRAVVEEVLGPECKAAGLEPTAEDRSAAKAFGGIRIDQTLYKKIDGDQTVIAMLWPWGDHEHTTLKMASFKQ